MRTAWLTLAALVLLSVSCDRSTDSRDDSASIPRVIGVVELLEHQDVADITSGLRDRLAELGHAEGEDVEVVVVNAQDQMSNLPHLFRELRRKRVSLVVPIFTPTAQATKQEFLDIPIIFAAVTDPVGAGLIGTWDQPGGNITGVSDQWPIERQLQLITRLVKDASRVAVLFNPGEQNSQSTLVEIQSAAANLGLTIVPIAVPTAGEVLQGTRRALREGDVVYTANTISVASGLEGALQLCQEEKVPLFAGDSVAVAKGAVATYSQSYRDIGVLTADLVDRVLSGERPGTIPVIISRSARLYINPQAARRMGVTIPPQVLNEAEILGSPTQD